MFRSQHQQDVIQENHVIEVNTVKMKINKKTTIIIVISLVSFLFAFIILDGLLYKLYPDKYLYYLGPKEVGAILESFNTPSSKNERVSRELYDRWRVLVWRTKTENDITTLRLRSEQDDYIADYCLFALFKLRDNPEDTLKEIISRFNTKKHEMLIWRFFNNDFNFATDGEYFYILEEDLSKMELEIAKQMLADELNDQ